MSGPWKSKTARAAWIFYQLRLQETSAAAVGRKMRPPASRRVMSYVINGQEVGLSAALVERVQRAVAKAVGAGFGELWGEGAIEATSRKAAKGLKP